MPNDVNENDRLRQSVPLLHAATRLGLMLSATLLLAGCATNGTATTSEAICADRRPILYNSKNPKSDYYAAKKLAPQLAVTNQIGVNLKCKAFQ